MHTSDASCCTILHKLHHTAPKDHDGNIEFDEFQAFYMSSRKRYEHEFLKLLSDHGVRDTVDKAQLTQVFTTMDEEIGLDFDIEVRNYPTGILLTRGPRQGCYGPPVTGVHGTTINVLSGRQHGLLPHVC